MAENSKIEWTDASWNPVRARNRETGGIGHFCVHASAGCANCYAETMQPRFRNFVRYAAQDRAKVEVFLDSAALLQPLRWRRPRRIFVCSMTDLFEDGHGDDMIDQVFAVMALCPQHTFQVLTKRAARMREYLSDCGLRIGGHLMTFASGNIGAECLVMDLTHRLTVQRLPLPNVWLGVSAEDQATADSRIPDLLATPAALRFVSYEPALGPVNFTRIMAKMSGGGESMWDVISPRVDRIAAGLVDDPLAATLLGMGVASGHAFAPLCPRIDWLIIGGESGRKARPFDIRWARDTIARCRAAGVPVFVKQLGAHPCNFEVFPASLSLSDKKGGNPDEWPEDLRVREFPGEAAE